MRRPPNAWPLISAHRGGGETGPTATYAAYEDAVRTGVEFAELDIRRLADGTLVVFHDAHAGPVGPNGAARPVGPALAGLGYAELCAVAGYEVPRVADVLAVLGATGGRVGAHLDLKEIGYESEVVDLAERFVGDRYVATSLEDESIRAITTRYPHARAALSLGWDLAELSRAAALGVVSRELFPMRRLRACGANGIAMHRRLARLRLLQLVEEHGLEAWVWTVDDDDGILEFLRDGRVTVLVTNRPRRAVGLRAALTPPTGIPLPRAAGGRDRLEPGGSR